MKYTETKIKELLAWPLGNARVNVSKEWCDWANEISGVVKQLQTVGVIHVETLELISKYGGLKLEADGDNIGISCNGLWCADQAAWVLEFGKDAE